MPDRHSLPTTNPSLWLRALSIADAEMYFDLVASSREHLTQHGDYLDMLTATIETVRAELLAPAESHAFGLWLDGQLIGRADLVPKGDGIFVIGYWLGAGFVGKGHMTVACRAMIDHARDSLLAHTIYAGVTKGNRASEALLARLAFAFVQDMGEYNRFRLDLQDDRRTSAPARSQSQSIP
jgi:ribosomal-protein-serine acetyltransferase